ncbi:unnamed protein product [Adineta steineri]|uniref:Uncharacterized protein n=1 Tax=Adineta steineri TaxID=433720 RepID=A0A815CDG7_9BILA|nr:unnamed protein product [Adineta steineri]CAF1311193.1 unnamed protein product [Adineta steineri]CAF1496258.1 unnamed protein product [Adineta steineri]CAF3621457.1 unnamed protein product [Adineta steineri]CAF3798567.1 unnamed protein product [Adineta steineri]
MHNYTVFINGQPNTNTNHTHDSITLSGFSNGTAFLSLFALDTYGLPIFTSFLLYFGSISMPVRILHANGSAAAGVIVNFNLTDNPRVGQSGVTDDYGMLIFDHVPPLTISIFAHTKDNQIGLAGVAPSNSRIDLTLIPFNDGKKMNELENREYLQVTTLGETLQTISRTFMTESNGNEAFVEYQFVTSEVPGGYFGSQFNDYFSVTLRSDKGQYITKTDSMNGLGLGAFNFSTGETAWNNLTLPVGFVPERIRFDIGVSNVGDGAFQSLVNIRKYGSDHCADCEKECVKCTSDPMCRDTCINPPMQTCTFYIDCLEAKAPCGSNGYALKYGMKNCIKFSNTIKSFTSQGQTWVWNTMNCLQKALVMPLRNCEKDCSKLLKIAFDSHPECYVNSGICDLDPDEWLTLLGVVGKDLFSLDSIIQALKTGSMCIPRILERISIKLEQVMSWPSRTALLILQKWLQSL